MLCPLNFPAQLCQLCADWYRIYCLVAWWCGDLLFWIYCVLVTFDLVCSRCLVAWWCGDLLFWIYCVLVLLWCPVGGCVGLVGSWVVVCCRLGLVLLVSWRVSFALLVSCSCCSCPARISMRISMVVCVGLVVCSVLLFSSWWVVVCWSCCGVLLVGVLSSWVGVLGSWARGWLCVVVWGSSCWFLGVCLLHFSLS